MHELAVTESLLQTASDYAKQNNADRVMCLNLVIGDLSGIVEDSVQFYWDMISENTICSQAKLNIERNQLEFEKNQLTLTNRKNNPQRSVEFIID